MIKLSLNIAQLSLPAFIETCKGYIQNVIANVATFATPSPDLTALNADLDELQSTYQKGLNGDRTFKHLQKQQRRAINAKMVQLRTYVEMTSGDDEATAALSGIPFRKLPERHSTVDQVQQLKATAIGNGSVLLNFKAVKNRTAYLIYVTTEMADVMNRTKWTLVATTGNIRYTATGLTRGTEYAFIVVAVGPHNSQGAPSDPAMVMAM